MQRITATALPLIVLQVLLASLLVTGRAPAALALALGLLFLSMALWYCQRRRERARPAEPHPVPGSCTCWYCGTNRGHLWFSCEFDAWVHPACIRERLQRQQRGTWPAEDVELRIMADELGVTP